MTTPAIGIDPVPVRLISPPPERKRDRVTTFRTVLATDIQAAMEGAIPILSHAPNRIRALLFFNQTSAVFCLAGSSGAAKLGNGAQIVTQTLSVPVELCGTDEVWLGLVSGSNTGICSLVQEFANEV